MQNLKTFRFKRVLFGVNASPFLLSATIKNHIQKFKESFPETVNQLDQFIYVDDFISGANTLPEALKVTTSANNIMSKAGMSLRKWISNDDSLMKCWKEEGLNTQADYATISLGSNLTKVLGVAWRINDDCLTLEVKSLLQFVSTHSGSKRFLLQAVGKIFDPLGLLTPFTIRIKCLFQELWKNKISWDGELPPTIQKQWKRWCEELPSLADLKIPRKILSYVDSEEIVELHAFSDASKSAYGSVVYLRVMYENGVEVNLVASKSRVAPLKEITLPRLELLGALLSARLVKRIKHILDQKTTSTVYYWTDSKIVLYWIKGQTKRWKQFVANRVTEIKSLSDSNCWYHCSTKDNPADLLSRGASVTQILTDSMWFKGPNFLKEGTLPISKETPDVPEQLVLSETKNKFKDSTQDSTHNISLLVKNDDFFNNLLNFSNNYFKLCRIVAYIFRFITNCRDGSKAKERGYLSPQEIRKAENCLIRLEQLKEFREDYSLLVKEGKVSSSSRIKNLCPFLDNEGLIRVGGRLQNSFLNYNSKYPILLPPKSKLTELIISSYHVKYLHSGPQNLLYQLRQTYWPLNGRNACRKIVHKCIKCFRCNPKLNFQKMGVLPKERVTPGIVFGTAGVDLCGPFLIRNKNQRKGSFTKIYVGIFVCLVTKARHLEIISDLTSDSLIAALKRFMSRRGKCQKTFSDNGNNMVRANKDLRKFFKSVVQDENLTKFCSDEQIEWKFIPPRAPNFGGLWEAGVKSFKYYFKRVVGNEKMTYESFLTVMIQIESMLNSRPLTPLSSDIDDLDILTPAHFLIGRTLTSIPEPSLTTIPTNRLSLWQRITKSVQTIWKRWSVNYLNNLQQRGKWVFEKENIKVGMMVLIKEDNLPLNKWILGRIVKTYAGKDNIVRVADVKTKTGIMKRSVSRLAVLPLDI